MRIRSTMLILVLLAIAGCSDSEFPLAPVAGRVTLDGEPLAGAHIGFEPRSTRADNRAGPGSYASTDEDGRFRLKTLNEQDGAVVGNHRVIISTFRAERGPKGEMVVIQKETLPARYHAQSELTMEVPDGGAENADFELESK